MLHSFAANRVAYIPTKYRSTFDFVIAERKMVPFFKTHYRLLYKDIYCLSFYLHLHLFILMLLTALCQFFNKEEDDDNDEHTALGLYMPLYGWP